MVIKLKIKLKLKIREDVLTKQKFTAIPKNLKVELKLTWIPKEKYTSPEKRQQMIDKLN